MPPAGLSLPFSPTLKTAKVFTAFRSTFPSWVLPTSRMAPMSHFNSSLTAVTTNFIRYDHRLNDPTNVSQSFSKCADITLSSSAQSPSEDQLKCKDATNVPSPSAIGSATVTGTSGSSSTTPTSPSGAGSSTGSSPTTSSTGAASIHAPVLSGVFGAIGLALAVL